MPGNQITMLIINGKISTVIVLMHMMSAIMNVIIFAAYKLVANGTIEKSW